MSKSFWNETMETMSARELVRIEEQRLRNQTARLYACSPYYRNRMMAAGFGPEGVRNRQELAALPFTEKEELAAPQRGGVLFGPHQAADSRDIVRIVATGGTSGRATRIGWSRSDIGDYNEMGARALWAMGCRPDDIVVNCFNYNVYAGGIMDHMAFEALGAAILPYGAGRSRALIDLLTEMPGCKALYTTPSYAKRLAGLAREAGIDPASLGVCKGFFSGEAGLQFGGYRDDLEREWNMSAQDLYGMAEAGVQSGECSAREGMHFCGGGIVLAELIDPGTGTPCPMQAGATGELVYTTLRREACPLLRLRTHDLVHVDPERCRCGRTSFRFHVLGRSDEMFIVKGVNVFPSTIHAVLDRLDDRLSGHFQVLLDRPPPIDYAPIVRVEHRPQAVSAETDALAQIVEEALQRHAGFSARVELVPPGALATEGKARRVVHTYRETPTADPA